jgi:hemerythrin-like domain-containing protein
MSATDRLRREHEVILSGLDVLQAMARTADAMQPLSSPEVLGLLDFFIHFADGCHHVKEEDMLFPALRRKGLRGPVELMMLEHDNGRSLLHIMLDAAPVLGQNPGARGRFTEAANRYVALMSGHVEKENLVLFEFADELLDEPAQAELRLAFDRHDTDALGQGEWDRICEQVSALARKHVG